MMINRDNSYENENENNLFTPLKSFHNVGTRGIFFYKAEHRDGFGLRLNGCHCCYCMRNYRLDGLGTMPTGCLSGEPYAYWLCRRKDKPWETENEQLLRRLSNSLLKQVDLESTIAFASMAIPQNLSDSLFCAFEIGQVLSITDDVYTINIFKHNIGTNEFSLVIPLETAVVSIHRLRYIIPNSLIMPNRNLVTLSNFCLEEIVKNCFNGISDSTIR